LALYVNTDHDVQALLVQKLPSGRIPAGNTEVNTGLVLLDSEVDLEAPEYLSSGFTALVFLAGTHEAVVPVHGRYHRPSDSSKPVKVDIEPPRVLLRSDQCRTLGAGVRGVVVEAPCTVSNHSICSWMEILDLVVMLIQPKCCDPGPQNHNILCIV
uniref:Phosphatidylinositol-glycan biosynthesis class X protein n=1 Tax=Sinocyclocheilus anshuiensis TaxID=1608454 RepID=A0A671N0V3_9TELE